MADKKITQAQIARELKIAPITVSAALAGKGKQYKLKPETVKLICDYAAEHGYIFNAAARRLRSGNTLQVGLIIETRRNYGFASSDALDYTMRELNKHNIDVRIAGGRTFLTDLQLLREQGCSAVIVFTPLSEFGTTAEFHKKANLLCRGMQIYALNYVFPRFYDKTAMPICRMGVDRIGVTELLLQAFECEKNNYLLDAHCFISSMELLCKDAKDADVFRNSLLDKFHKDVLLPTLPGLTSGDYASVGREWFDYYLQTTKTRAIKNIFVRDDRIAAVLISNALRCNIRIPEDLQIVSFDNLDLGKYLQVPLTSWGVPWLKHAKLALSSILDKVELPQDTISVPDIAWRGSAVLAPQKHTEFQRKLQEKYQI